MKLSLTFQADKIHVFAQLQGSDTEEAVKFTSQTLNSLTYERAEFVYDATVFIKTPTDQQVMDLLTTKLKVAGMLPISCPIKLTASDTEYLALQVERKTEDM